MHQASFSVDHRQDRDHEFMFPAGAGKLCIPVQSLDEDTLIDLEIIDDMDYNFSDILVKLLLVSINNNKNLRERR